MKTKYLLTMVLCVLFACSKDNTLINDSKNNNKRIGDDILLWTNVKDGMDQINAIEIEIPPDWEYDLAKDMYNWSIMKLFLDNAGMYYEVYIWAVEPNAGFMLAEEECHHIWDNGDCKDDGTQCDVIIENGKAKIICCDDKKFYKQDIENGLTNLGATEISIPDDFEYSAVNTGKGISSLKEPVSDSKS